MLAKPPPINWWESNSASLHQTQGASTPRYHFWDFESDSGKPHTLSLRAVQIHSVEVLLDSGFEPETFVTWPTNWAVPRTTWGSKN